MKRFTAILLCAVLVFFSPSAAYASSAGSVVVTGGSIASGGLSGGYSGKSESAAITLTMALMYSLGITVKLSQDAINAGQSAYSYVKGKFYEWVGGSSAEQITDSQYEDLKSRFSVITSGSNVDPDGKIYFNGTALDMIRRFLNWLKSNNYINNSSGSGSSASASINNVPTLFTTNIPVTNGRTYWFGTTINTYENQLSVLVYNIVFNGTNNLLWVSTTYRPWYRSRIDSSGSYSSGGNQMTRNSGNYYWTLNIPDSADRAYIFSTQNSIATVNIDNEEGNSIYSKIDSWLLKASGDIGPGGSVNDEGLNYEGDFDPDTLNNPDGKQTVVNPPVIDPMEQQNPDTNAQIGVEKYLELLKQLLNKYTNPQTVADPVPAQDLPTLSPIELPVPDNLPVSWPVELPSSPTAPEDLPQDSTPVVDPNKPADPDISIPEMSAHLEDYFPFCLPFDVYKIMQKFNGSPQAPQVHLSFDAPVLNIHIPLDLDFSVFDSVAAVLRNGEAVLYVVGLAVVTRKTFLRG